LFVWFGDEKDEGIGKERDFELRDVQETRQKIEKGMVPSSPYEPPHFTVFLLCIFSSSP
jgi:hypothetical protein